MRAVIMAYYWCSLFQLLKLLLLVINLHLMKLFLCKMRRNQVLFWIKVHIIHFLYFQNSKIVKVRWPLLCKNPPRYCAYFTLKTFEKNLTVLGFVLETIKKISIKLLPLLEIFWIHKTVCFTSNLNSLHSYNIA